MKIILLVLVLLASVQSQFLIEELSSDNDFLMEQTRGLFLDSNSSVSNSTDDDSDEIREGPISDYINVNVSKKDIDELKDEYGSIYDIPRDKANFTDSKGHVHPLWSSPFFKVTFKSFDNLIPKANPSNKELFQHLKSEATCLKTCYFSKYKNLSSPSKDELTQYKNCKLNCFTTQLENHDKLVARTKKNTK